MSNSDTFCLVRLPRDWFTKQHDGCCVRMTGCRIAQALIGLTVLAIASLPAAAGTEPPADPAKAGEARKLVSGETEAGRDETCAAADGKEPCKEMPAFPPLDTAASLFSAMFGCSRTGM